MRVDVSHRRLRRVPAVVLLILFAFSASTSLLPCANDMMASTTQQAEGASQVSNAHASHASHGAPPSHASHAPHAAQDTPASTPPAHHAPASGSCPWVVGCTGMVQLAFESSWRLLETTPVVSAPTGVVLRAVTAEREVESPPPRA